MKQIAIFNGFPHGPDRIDKRVNEWLKKHPNLNVLDIRTCPSGESGHEVTVTVLYDLALKTEDGQREENGKGA